MYNRPGENTQKLYKINYKKYLTNTINTITINGVICLYFPSV